MNWPAGSLRAVEHQSIRDFVQSAADDGYLSGRVLDYGCGKQPYRDIVEVAGGEYHGFDLPEFPANVGAEHGTNIDWDNTRWNAILCTQVVQYLRDVSDFIEEDLFVPMALTGGVLVLTYPTNWPEVEPEDLHRFTKAGMERLLTDAGFKIVRHDWRHGFRIESGESFAAGYGVIARA